MNSSDTEHLGRAIDEITAPRFDFSAVQARVRSKAAPPRARQRGLIASVLFAILLPALAAAAVHYLPVRVVQSGNGSVQVYAQSVEANSRATPDTLKQLARRASYRVVWPASLPAKARLGATMAMASQLFFVVYRCPDENLARFIIAPINTAARGDVARKWPIGVSPKRATQVYYWNAGTERVRLDTSCLTKTEVARVRSAMIAAGRSSAQP